ncbi:hypothetical protein MCW82_16600 [Azospirillum doebereinerae]|uniref:hypothetical protein n=1 Tax=Azospirillum doebereinerae TaxID=92933 RepID=UPI001EE5ED0B|nr:hypothetical protein [Azospirillum doebereinerae]MCG5241396.1 hypothetical protein [Azospirillum doebereinerae]
MAPPTLDTEIDLINAALTSTGNSPITSLEDGTTEATVAASNFDRVLGAELAYPWTWMHATRALNRVDIPSTDTSWRFAFQVPDDFEVERLEHCGHPIPWDSLSDWVVCNVEDGVIARGRWRPPVREWPAEFRAALCVRLEALFLRSLSEDFDKAARRDQDAERAFRAAKLADSRRRSPRRPGTSALLEARRG